MGKELINAVLDNDEVSLIDILNKRDFQIINYQDESGFTALHYAIQDNKYDFVVKILESGANFELQDKYGNTPLIKATASFRGDGRIIQLLLSKGADKNRENNYGTSAIKHAKNVANYDITQYFK